MIPHDADTELDVIATSAQWPDLRERFVAELLPRDFYDPRRRALFVRLAELHAAGELVQQVEICGLDVRSTWSGLDESENAALRAIVAVAAQLYIVAGAIAHLRMLTKRRAVLAAAERVLAGESLPDPLLEWLLEEGAAW